MQKYDYEDAVYEDVKKWIEYNVDLSKYDTPTELVDYLNNELWDEDCITGNGSGSYTCNVAEAEGYLCGNLYLLAEAAEEFCCAGEIIDLLKNPEAADVTIRCYLLPLAICKAVEELY